MTENIFMYIIAGLGLVALIMVILLIFINKGLNREVNALVNSYQNLSSKVDLIANDVNDQKLSDQHMIQTVQTGLGTFGEMISRNQRDTSESMDKRLEAMNQRLANMSAENEQKLENIRTGTETRLKNLTEENSRQLEKMRETVDEKLQKTLEDRISQSFKLVSERLEQVYEGLGEMKTLASGVGDLKKVLSNVKTRGILGEVQLGAILEQVLSHEQYDTDVATVPGSRERVEFAVKLPADDDRYIYLPIDSKFPGERYAALRDAYESGEKAQVDSAWKALEATLKSEAKDIREKYVRPPYTTEFGIMFLPFEGLYSEVVNRGMLEILQREYKINIAGPTTMAALLNSLQMGFKTLAIQKHSSEVWELLGAVKGEFGRFEATLESARSRLAQADKELENLVGTRTRQINRKLKSVEALGSAEAKNLLELTDFEEE